jgi:hypothetical protein
MPSGKEPFVPPNAHHISGRSIRELWESEEYSNIGAGVNGLSAGTEFSFLKPANGHWGTACTT